MINIDIWQNALVIAINIIGFLLVILVMFANGKKDQRLLFLLANIAMFGWVDFAHFARISSNDDLRVLFLRIAWFVTPMLFLFIYYFSLLLTKNVLKNRSSIIANTIIIFTLSVLAGFTDTIIESFTISNGSLQITYGWLMIPFLVGVTLIMFSTIQPIVKVYRDRSLTSIEFKQLHPYVIGLSIFYILNLIFNISLPIVFRSTRLYYLGDYSTIILLLGIAYSIVRFQFLDVRLLLGRILYYFLISILPATLIIVAVNLGLALPENINFGIVLATAIVGGLFFVVLFESTNKFLKTQVTTRILNPEYDPEAVFERYNQKVSRLLEIDKIKEELISTVKQSIRPSEVEVIFNNSDNSNEFTNLFPLMREYWRQRSIDLIIWRQIRVETSSGLRTDKKSEAYLFAIKESFEKKGIRIVSPIIVNKKVIGAYIFGLKEADTPYNSVDIDFINRISAFTNVSIERALLYDEVQNFANTLQGKVDDATLELQQALAQLQEARRQERDMMDVMGHELRTPISIVRNAWSMLEMERNKNNGQVPQDMLNRYIDMGLESTRREIRLIETLLSATKVDSARLQLYLTRVDYKDVVNDALEGHKARLDKKELNIVYNPPADDIFVYCDRTRIQEVMDNFLSNAVKYTPEGQVAIDIWQNDEFGYISVADTGYGISAEDLKNLGKKFFRAKQYTGGEDDTNIVRPGGTGLGLYVTFELIRAMSGKLWINSEVGQGTTFTFAMPTYHNEQDKQFDQTFDQDHNRNRDHIIINGEAPRP